MNGFGFGSVVPLCLPAVDDGFVINVAGTGNVEFSWTLVDSDGVVSVSGSAGASSSTCSDVCDGDILTMNLYDDWGDGWGTATAAIYECDGSTVAEGLTFSTGTEHTLPGICVDAGGFVVSAGGDQWDSEISWDFVDNTGSVIGSGVAEINHVVGDCGAFSGCMDPDANNYAAAAWIDDGSCEYPPCTDGFYITCGGGGWPEEVSWSITTVDGSQIASGGCPHDTGECVSFGGVDSYHVEMLDSWGDGWNGNVLTVGTCTYTLEDGASGTAESCTANV